MAVWWFVLALVLLALAGFLVRRARRPRTDQRTAAHQAGVRPRPDFPQDREDDRRARMSEADRTWEAASLQRERDAHTRDAPPPEPPA